MNREYAIILGTMDQALEGYGLVVFKNQYPEYILAELIRLDDDNAYIVEEYTVDEDGEFYEGSDYDTAENFKRRFGTWYAVCENDEDGDWGTGSYDRCRAFEMLRNYPEGHIDVVEMGTDPRCIEVLHAEDE